MENIVIIGASGHARVVIDVIEKEGAFNIIGLIDAYQPTGTKMFDYEVLGEESALPALIGEYRIAGGIVAIGDNWTRHKIVRRLLEIYPGFSFVTAIHPSACVARGVTIGRGTVVMAGCVINSASQIGDFCIINTNSSIDHDNRISDYASVAPGATTGGDVALGRFSAISLGAKVVHGVAIGDHTVIGAGATLLDDVPSHSIALGAPAIVTGTRKEGDKYL